ncbi:MAG: glycosyltransferase family protein [bacterium]|nr:glycosyltransferase family protein [bacterium]
MSARPVAVIQARLGSTRLPGKVLADVGGAPMLVRMIERVRAATTLADVCLAVPEGPADEPLRALAAALDVPCHAGPEDDVLSRYAGAAARWGADPVVRLTADCPLVDPALVDRCVETFRATDGCEFASLGGSFPDGLDCEVVSAAALGRAHREARLRSEREHVTPFIWKRPDVFRCAMVRFPERLGHLRWTVDEPRDLELVRAVYAHLYVPGRVFGWEAIAGLLAREPALAALNARIERNAGYQRSLAHDAVVSPAIAGAKESS